MNTTIHLRRYSPEDLAPTISLWHASKRAAFPYVAVQQRYTLAEDTAYFRDVVAVECVVWLAEVARHLAGLLALKNDYIDQFFVAVALQRQGVGTALLHKAREQSPRGLRLLTFQKNTSARGSSPVNRGDRHQMLVNIQPTAQPSCGIYLRVNQSLTTFNHGLVQSYPARAFYEKHGFKAIRFGHSPAPENEPDVEYQWWP